MTPEDNLDPDLFDEQFEEWDEEDWEEFLEDEDWEDDLDFDEEDEDLA